MPCEVVPLSVDFFQNGCSCHGNGQNAKNCRCHGNQGAKNVKFTPYSGSF